MKNRAIKSEIFEILREAGIPLSGVANLNQSSSTYSEITPKSLLENANSVVCLAIPIPKGIIFSKDNSMALYWRYCNIVYRKLDIISNDLCLFLENLDNLALPIYSCFPWKVINREFWGVLPLIHWAEEAGLGRLAKCGLLVNPKYGTRILLGGVITTLDLEPDKKLIEKICPADCNECLESCPVKAINENGKVNHDKCVRYSGSNPLLELVLKSTLIQEKYSFDDLLNTIAVDDHGMYTCMECLKACPLNQK